MLSTKRNIFSPRDSTILGNKDGGNRSDLCCCSGLLDDMQHLMTLILKKSRPLQLSHHLLHTKLRLESV